jgi:glycosyltransferase involved in cell wall biosynthesis
MKIAYISHQLGRGKSFGGGVVTYANLSLLQQEAEVTCFAISRIPIEGMRHISAPASTLQTGMQNLRLFSGLLSHRAVEHVLRELDELCPDIVWLDSSLYGRLIAPMRRRLPQVRVVSFFHNIERDFIISRLKEGKLQYLPTYFSDCFNESRTAANADACVTLHQGDSMRLAVLYGRRANYCLPVSLHDVFDSTRTDTPCDEPTPYILFVGALFGPNLEAARYLSRDISPRFRGRVLIVGKGFEAARDALQTSNLKVVGGVSDLAPYYFGAKVVVAPVFSGAGMKVKIAEALMHGKRVVASPQAAVGYEAAVAAGVVRIARDPDEFAALCTGPVCPSNSSSRNIFSEHYSLSAGRKAIQSILKDVMHLPRGSAS